MKIAVVCDVLGEENNGTTIAAMNLIRHLRSVGADLRVLCADESKKGMPGFYVTPNKHLIKPLEKYVEKVGVKLPKCDEEIVEQALDGVDYIHCILPFPLAIHAAKYAKAHGIPISAGFHMQAENLTSYLRLDKLTLLPKLIYVSLYKFFYSQMDAIHYPTEFIRGVFERSIGKVTNGYVISNGVNDCVRPKHVDKPEQYRDEIVVLSIGRYSKEKSQDTLLKAVKYSRYKDKIRLILAGQGLKEKKYKRLAKKLPLAPVFGFFLRDEILDVINYADLYVHPATYELEGIACLEAIMCGKLTIVSDSPLSATHGFAVDESCVFKSRKPKDLARVLDYWIDNPDLRREYGEKYGARADDLRVESCMRKMDEMFKKTYAEVKAQNGGLS